MEALYFNGTAQNVRMVHGLHNTSSCTIQRLGFASFIITLSHQTSCMKGAASVWKALQHINAKTCKLHMTLLDFSETAQEDQLVNLARRSMSMCKLMTNPAHSAIVGIDILEWGNLVKVCSLMLARRHKFDMLEWENLVKFCSLMLSRRHAFNNLELDALCCEQHRSIFYLCLQFCSKHFLWHGNLRVCCQCCLWIARPLSLIAMLNLECYGTRHDDAGYNTLKSCL
jgi:hypothetical protein